MKKVSVLMGIYNCQDTLEEAIDSIISQTYTNWELIMCDDGSSDQTFAIAQKYKDKYPDKIVLLKHKKNQGLNVTLNDCLEIATGEYVARMDGDDISLPERFEKEVEFLNSHQELAIVSTPMIYFDGDKEWGRRNVKEIPSPLDFIKGTPFCHAPCMVRAEAFNKIGGYSTNSKTIRAEDYDLWFRMYEAGYTGANLPVAYYKMRDDMNAYRRRKFQYCFNEAYVRFNGYRKLSLPWWSYIFVLRPVVVGLLPQNIYLLLHRLKK